MDDRAVGPGRSDELATSDRLAAASGERRQQPELGGGQCHALPFACRGVRHRVEPKVADRGGGVASAPLEQRLNACQQLGEGEGLRQIVVAPRAEARQPIDHRVARRQEENRGLEPAGAKRLADIAPVSVRQADVDHQHVRWVLGGGRDRLGSASDRNDLEAFLVERLAQQAAKVGVVLDDQCSGVRHRFH